MMPGEFYLRAHQQGVITLPPLQPGGSGLPGQSPGQVPTTTSAVPLIASTGFRPSTGIVSIGPALAGPPGGGSGNGPAVVDLEMELYHGDEFIVSGVNVLPPQLTPSDGDDTWRVRLQLAPDAPAGDYSFSITLDYPSAFPILTRRIPLAFFQQGFDNNWNGRQYISLGFADGELVINFDPELASYYGLSNVQYVAPGFPTLVWPNILVSDVRLSMDSSDGPYVPSYNPYKSLPGPLPYVLLTVTFTGVNNLPISGSIGDVFDVSVDDFSINIKFFLTSVTPLGGDITNGTVGYESQVDTDLLEKLQVNIHAGHVLDHVGKLLDDGKTAVEKFLDGHAAQVGAAITPWLLGASFGVVNVRYDPANSQPVPPKGKQGDLVIDYIGQPPTITNGPPPFRETPDSTSTVPLTLSRSIPSPGTIAQPYSQVFAASGGVGPYDWTIGGALPPGTTVDGAALSGTPSAAGVYSVAVTVRDSADTQVSQTYTAVINPSGLSITTDDPLPDGVIASSYAKPLTAKTTQSATGVQCVWSSTNLPPGLMLSPQGVITGTPSGASGSASFVVEVTDSSGRFARKAFSLTLQDPQLFPDVIYAPRGDANTLWQPSLSAPQIQPGAPRARQPKTTPGSLSKVDHIVLVMMENRSFDHMLGYLSREGGRTDIEGLKWEASDNATQYNYYKGKYYYPNLLTDTHIINTENLSPDHSHEAVKAQMADGMMHFVSDYAKNKAGDDPDQLRVVMGYYGASQLPVYDMLARNYAVCDHWFCSHVGPTWPNRFVAMTGDLNRDSYGEPEVNTPLYTDFTPSEALTLFDHLTARGVTWKYFQQRESMMRAFTRYSFDMENVLEYTDPVKGFHAAVSEGLPSFTWVDPLFGDLPAGINSPQDNDDAPPSDLYFGQLFIQDVFTTLFSPRSNPRGWEKTMLIIVYDEHGGFYDHVDPPTNATPLLGQNSGKLGPRVPAFVVSPFTPAGLVLKDTFDHGTIAATVLRRFCSPNPPFMSARVSAALDLRDALPLPEPLGAQVEAPIDGAVATAAMRTALRRFKVPTAADSFGPSLGGVALTLGATPGSQY
jgi:phospholipase C